MAEPFGFTVTYEEARPAGLDGGEPAGWTVTLPHQCEHWDIGQDQYGPPSPHAEAVARLERFIAEAQAALAALRECKTFPPDAD